MASMKPVPTLRRLTPTDAESYRAIRLEGLRSHPEAFGVTCEEEAGQPLPWFAERLERNAIFGGWLEEPILAGVAGLLVPEAAKLRHKGLLWGMFIRPAARGRGLAAALVQRVIEAAADTVEELRLTVVASNIAAVRLYTHRGFRKYGVEPRALKVGNRYHDEVLMALPLRKPDEMHASELRTGPT
jgi:RimJ/RimL family protein N-acetyltransferase